MMWGSWWGQWFGGRGPRDAKALQGLLTQICRQETALANHLADRARAVRFAPHRLSLEGMAEREGQNAHVLAREIRRGTTLVAAEYTMPRPGTLTATKLIQDLAETENLAAMYWQAGQLTSDGTFRGKLEGLAAEEARSSWTIRGILATMDGYVTDSPEAARRGLELPSPQNAARLRARARWARAPIR
jgi:hypothetical protein